MARRMDYYYRELVTEAELDAGFDGLEAADRFMMADFGLVGIASGAVVVQHSPTPNLTIDVTGSAAIYDQVGQRIAIPSLQTIDMSVDSNSVSTSVTTPGNEKWVSIFVKFTRALSDPRLDGNLNTVYFVRDESIMFIKTQGAEAAIGAGPKPALMSDAILLADVQRTQAQTQILTANISTLRRQDAFVFSAGALAVRAGTPEASDSAILTLLNNHVTQSAGAHAATAISYAGGGSWQGGTSPTNPSTTVEAQLDKIIADLAATTSSASGMDRLGSAALVGVSSTIAAGTAWAQLTALKSAANLDVAARTTWLGGRTNAAATLYAAIDKIITDLAATTASDDGAERIGFNASGNFTGGDVHAALTELTQTTASNDGGKRIGAAAVSGTYYSLSLGTVASQLAALLAALDTLRPGAVVVSCRFQTNGSGSVTYTGAVGVNTGLSSIVSTQFNVRFSTPFSNTNYVPQVSSNDSTSNFIYKTNIVDASNITVFCSNLSGTQQNPTTALLNFTLHVTGT